MNAGRGVLIALVVLVGAVLAVLWRLARVDEPASGSPSTVQTRAELPEEPAALQSAPSDPVREAPPEAAVPEGYAVAGTLVVTLTGGGAPVSGGTVEVNDPYGGHRASRIVNPRTGAATFEQLPPGPCRIHVHHLAEGWLPPRVLRRKGKPEYLETQIHPGANTFEVVLESPAHVSGILRGPDGRSLGGNVELSWLEEGGNEPERCKPFLFDASDGDYDGDVYPGVWSVAANGRPKGETEHSYTTPIVRRLAAGSATIIDVDFDPPGSGRIEVRTLDEKGEAFSGARIQARRFVVAREPISGREFEVSSWACAGDASSEGKLSLGKLRLGRYRLDVEPGGFHPFDPPGSGTLGAEFEPVKIEVKDDGPVDVDLVVRRSHPVRVRGRVDSAPKGSGLQLVARVGGRTGATREWKLVPPSWAFDFFVEAAAADPRIELTLGKKTEIYPLVLDAAVENPLLVLRFPKGHAGDD